MEAFWFYAGIALVIFSSLAGVALIIGAGRNSKP